MRRSHRFSSRLLIVGVMAMVAVVTVFSYATRRPYNGTNNVTWHNFKAGRMKPALARVTEYQALRHSRNFERHSRVCAEVVFLAGEPTPFKSFFFSGVDKFRSPPSSPS
jgi:hypothetical protein